MEMIPWNRASLWRPIFLGKNIDILGKKYHWQHGLIRTVTYNEFLEEIKSDCKSVNLNPKLFGTALRQIASQGRRV